MNRSGKHERQPKSWRVEGCTQAPPKAGGERPQAHPKHDAGRHSERAVAAHGELAVRALTLFEAIGLGCLLELCRRVSVGASQVDLPAVDGASSAHG